MRARSSHSIASTVGRSADCAQVRTAEICELGFSMFTTPGLPNAVFEALVRASVMDRMCDPADGPAAAACACKRVLASKPKAAPIFRDMSTPNTAGAAARPSGLCGSRLALRMLVDR